MEKRKNAHRAVKLEDCMENGEFHTFQGYMKKESGFLTASMEDYIEMICRLSAGSGFTRVNELSRSLHVQPSSATKMVRKLAEMGYVRYEKYSYLMLEESGRKLGEWLMMRHRIIEEFLRLIGVGEADVLQETEKAEHVLSRQTVLCLERFTAFLAGRPEIGRAYESQGQIK